MGRGYVISAAVGAVAAGVVGVGIEVAARAISGPRRPALDYRFTPFEVGVPSEDVEFHAADGTRIAGWWLERPDSSRVVIVCHGHRGSKADMLGIGPGLWRAGNSVLMFDFRGNGDSGDGPQSLAHYEQEDLAAAVDMVTSRRPDADVAALGFSMGAAVALLTAADDPRISALVLDSPFSEMNEVVTAAARRMRLPPFPLVPLVDRRTRLRYGYRFHDVRPIDVADRLAPRPVLFLHGGADRTIPPQQSLHLHERVGPSSRRVVFPGADHCGGYFQDRAGYISLVSGFFDEVLGPVSRRPHS